MFEECLVESRGLVASKTQRWTALGSVGLQCALAALLIAMPLLRPQRLAIPTDAPHLTIPLPIQPPPPMHVQAATASSSAAPSLPTESSATSRPLIFSSEPTPGPTAPQLPVGIGIPMGDDPFSTAVARIGTGTPGPNVAVAPSRNPERVTLSSGVTQGMLLTPIQPLYPPIARAAGIQGTVVIEAVISKAGHIESLRIESGPEMLRGAARDAVAAARYRPYLLNGEPTEVQTTVTINFRMGG